MAILPDKFNPLGITLYFPIENIIGVYTYKNNVATSNGMTIKNKSIGSTLHDDTIKIFQRGKASNITISSGANGYIRGNGIINNSYISSGGTLYLSGGTATYCTVNSSGNMTIYNGIASTCFVTNGGIMYASSSCNISNLRVYAGGIISTIHQYTDVSSATIGGSGYFSSGRIKYICASGTNAKVYFHTQSASNCSAIAGGQIYGMEGSLLKNFSAGGIGTSGANNPSIYMSANGRADKLYILNGGKLYIPGGTVTSSIISSGGTGIVSNGGTTTSTIVSSGGTFIISSGGTSLNNNLIRNAVLTIGQNVTLNQTTITCTGITNNYPVINVNGTLSGGTVSNRTINVLANGTLESTTITNATGKCNVSAGGLIESTTITNNGSCMISAGGTGNILTVNGGTLTASSSYVQNSVVQGGRMYLYDAEYLTGTIKTNGTYVSAYGGKIDSVVVSNAGQLHIIGSNTTIGSGSSLQVASWGQIHTSSGGYVKVCDIQSDGYLIISNAASGYDLTVNNGGTLLVKNGGTAINVTSMTGGTVTIEPGGTITTDGGTQVEPTEGVVIYENNDATGNIISSGAYISYVSIGLGGVGNGMVVYNNGSAFEVNIIDEGTMIVSNGGSADYVYINDNSTLIVKSGGIVTHAVEDGAANAIIDIEPGGSLNWD